MQVAILFALVTLALAQSAEKKEMSCKFEERSPSMVGGGWVSGTFKYSWAKSGLLATYTTSGLKKLYDWNSGNGWGASDPYNDQYNFEYGPCKCTVASLSYPQPAFFTNPSYSTCTGNTCNPKGAKSLITSVTLASSGYPSTIEWNDGRTWTVSDCTSPNFKSSDFTQPNDCTCGKPIDIVLVLDRSSSINKDEFKLEKQFTQDLVESFSCSATGVNFGITNFHTYSWDGPVTLLEGNTDEKVRTGADALQCAPFPQCVVAGSAGSCCGTGTSISSGIVNGADMLASVPAVGFRASAAKVLIVLTDGYHNRILKRDDLGNLDRSVAGKPSGVNYYVGKTRCSENGASECVEGLNADIDFAVNYLKDKAPNVTVFAVGVGDTWKESQLERIALGNPDNVIGTRDWAQLTSLVGELVSKTCEQSAEGPSCESCCGLCSCGECAPADGCAPGNFCDSVKVVGSCCTTTPKLNPCPPLANKCMNYFCNRSGDGGKGACDSSPIPPPTNSDPCIAFECDPDTGLWSSSNICPPPPKCVKDSDCDDGKACTVDKCYVDPVDDQKNECSNAGKICPGTVCATSQCDPATGNCVDTPKPVPPSTMCYKFTCVEIQGIVRSDNMDPPCPESPICLTDADCNDNNVCTDEFCKVNPTEPLLNSCERSDKDVATFCAEGTNACNTPRCDPTAGCVFDLKPIPPNTTCFVYSCDVVTGEISSENICPPPPLCVTTADCDDGNACTDDLCVDPNTTDSKCTYAPVVCNDSNPCTVDSCDPIKGCIASDLPVDFCNDNNNCTIDTCDPLSTNLTFPCTYTNVTCPTDNDVCHEYKCDVIRGCELLDRLCPTTKNCTVSGCNATNDKGCYVKSAGTCGAPPVALIAGLTAGVVAGIVIAAVAGALMIGGGAAFAFTQASGSGVGSSVAMNPIYQAAGTSGSNPLNRA